VVLQNSFFSPFVDGASSSFLREFGRKGLYNDKGQRGRRGEKLGATTEKWNKGERSQ
jgi:hypothetical protein